MRHKLWKSVEIFSGSRMPLADTQLLPPASFGEPGDAASSQAVEACSACAGDYEDPDRTAGTDEESEEDVDAAGDEFPAEEE